MRDQGMTEDTVGRVLKLSKLDIEGMNRLYNC